VIAPEFVTEMLVREEAKMPADMLVGPSGTEIGPLFLTTTAPKASASRPMSVVWTVLALSIVAVPLLLGIRTWRALSPETNAPAAELIRPDAVPKPEITTPSVAEVTTTPGATFTVSVPGVLY
jgi:hypothetical protein